MLKYYYHLVSTKGNLMAEPLHMYAILTGNNGIQDEINKLNSQIQTLQPGTPEYEYDQLVLQREQIELKTRSENPNLASQTLAGNEALNQLLLQNPAYQSVLQQITDLCNAYPSECTSWGIPMASQDVSYVEIN
jgi:hypothetical protein